MSTTKLTDVYKQVLACAGMVVDDEGFISVKSKDGPKPALIDGKRLVMPYVNQLRSGDTDTRIIFHPLRENIMKGESEVITKLRTMINIKLNYTFGAIALQLLNLTSSPADQGKLNPFQSEMLSEIGPVGSNISVKFTSILMHAIKQHADRGFINIFLRKGGSVKGVKYSRVGAVTFPFMEELAKEQASYYGTELSKKDKLALQNLMKYMFPDIDKPEAYYKGSSNEVAPFMDCLMNSIYGVAGRLNDLLELFSGIIVGGEDLIMEADWVETFKGDLSELLTQIREIPLQATTDGRSNTNEMPKVVAPAMPLQQALQQPVNTYQHPQHVPQQQYIAPQQIPQGPVVTANGVDLNSIIRSNPALAGYNGAGNMPQYMQPPPPPVPQHLQQWAMYGQPPPPQQYGMQPQQGYYPQNNGYNNVIV